MNPLTVRELIKLLENAPEDAQVYLRISIEYSGCPAPCNEIEIAFPDIRDLPAVATVTITN